MRQSLPPFRLMASLVLSAFPLSAAPLITEFLASNTTGLIDEDSTLQDWIEIHNPDGTAFNLGGYHLTDDDLNPDRWTFPAGVTIPPGGYLVVFASNKNRAVAGSELHTNFALSNGGEYLALNAPGGTPVLSFFSPAVQSANVSYGLLGTTPGSPVAYFNTPTPGAVNNTTTAPAADVQFTPASSTFPAGTTLNVALSVASPSAAIRYTTNRSLPISVAGITGTFTVNATTDVLTMAAHGLSSGDMVRVASTAGVLAAPLLNSINYFVIVQSADTFKITNAPGGPPFDLTSAGSGTQALRRDAAIATAAASDIFSTIGNHPFFNGDPVQVSSTGTLPGGVLAGTTYYVTSSAATSFRLSTSATGTPTVDVIDVGTGIHTVARMPSPLYSGPIPVTLNTRVRARAYEPGRPDGAVRGEMYFAIDGAAQNFSSTVPIVVSTTWNTAMTSDVTVDGHIMIFEPKAPDGLARITNSPDLAAPCTLERRGSSTAGDPKYSMAVELQDEYGQDRNFGVLGMPSDSDWVMHAPYSFDRSMMHNDLIYRLSNDAGRYAVRTKFVEHFHNVQSLPNTIGGAGWPALTQENSTVLAIPDTNVSVTSVLNPSGAHRIDDLNVSLNITHPRRGDLKVQLTSPAGTTVDLVLPSGDASADFDVVLDSQSVNLLDDGNADTVASPFYDRVAIPASALTAFNGQPVAGTWTLRVTDTVGGNAGSVNRWRLQFQPEISDHFGVYSFMEKITREEDRVDVENMSITDNTAPAVQGGYMFKVDRLDTGDGGITPLAGQSFGPVNTIAWVYPKENSPDPFLKVTAMQRDYLRGYIGSAWASLQPAVLMDPVNGYPNYFDVPSVIDHQILNIAAKNVDANRLSAYWFKPRFGKLTAGPIWDFDRAEGSTDGRDLNPVTWRGDNGDLGTDFFHYPWFNEMFKDPNFWQAYIDRYHEMRMTMMSTAEVFARIDEFAAILNPGDGPNTPAKRSGARWIGPRGAAGNTPGTNGTYAGEIAWLKNWWNSRLNFMDGQFTRPAVSSLPDGPVTPGSSVVLTSPSQSTAGVKIYYTTDGTDPRIKATAPDPPGGTYTTVATLLRENTTVRAIVPTSNAAGGTAPNFAEWHGADLNSNGNNADDFDDTTWFTNAADTINGVGYDNAPAVNYLPFLNIRWNTSTFHPATVPLPSPVPVSPVGANTVMQGGTIGGTAYAGNQSCFIRIPFTVTAGDMALLVPGNRVTLQMRYDDGFVAWINGTELTNATNLAPATRNAPAAAASPPAYPFGAFATVTHDDTASTQYVDFDITSFASSLHAGTNLLAIQGLNQGLASSDFLIGARIVIQSPPPPYTPAVSPSAVEYTGPINITGPTQLFVRTVNPVRPSDPPTQGGGGTGPVPNGSSWSAPTRLYYFPGAEVAAQANIKITEVLYHPAPPATDEIDNGWTVSNDFEFIRLTNMGSAPVDLTGIYFSNGLEFTAVPGLQNWLPAGQSVVVVENTAAFIYRYGTTFTILGEFSGELDDGGEHIVLNDKTGAVISDFRYGDDSPWPESADDGHSLLYTTGDPNLPGSWRGSADPGGTSVTTYDRWLRRYFPASEVPFQLMSQDDDGDGLNNFGEYIFVTDPRVPGSGEHAMATAIPGSPARMALRRRAGATDVTWTFETTSNLASWTSAGGVLESVVNNGDGTETATWRSPALPVPPGRLLMRAKATNP